MWTIKVIEGTLQTVGGESLGGFEWKIAKGEREQWVKWSYKEMTSYVKIEGTMAISCLRMVKKNVFKNKVNLIKVFGFWEIFQSLERGR